MRGGTCQPHLIIGLPAVPQPLMVLQLQRQQPLSFFFLIVNLTDSLCFSKHSSYNWICGFSAKPDWQPTFSQWAHGRTGTALPFYGSVKKGGGDKNRCVPLVISTATLPVPSISIGRRSSSLIHWMQSTL